MNIRPRKEEGYYASLALHERPKPEVTFTSMKISSMVEVSIHGVDKEVTYLSINLSCHIHCFQLHVCRVK
jgi:hypothetical protein